MAGEIVIPLIIRPDDVTDANGFKEPVPTVNGLVRLDGWRLPYTVAVNYAARLARPIPANVHATTPNAQLVIDWITANADVANAMRLFAYGQDVQPDTDSNDPSAWDDSVYVTQPSHGAFRTNTETLTLTVPGISFAAGRRINWRIRRDRPGTASDLLAANAWLLGAWLVLDQA